MTEDDHEAQVIRLHVVPDLGAEDDGAIVPDVERKRKAYGCQHSKMVLDAQSRRMYCDKSKGGCGEEVDLYEWIEKLIADWDRWTTGYRQARAQAQRAGKAQVEVERLERNAKGRLKAVRKRLADSGETGIRLELLEALWEVLGEESEPEVARLIYDRVRSRLSW